MSGTNENSAERPNYAQMTNQEINEAVAKKLGFCNKTHSKEDPCGLAYVPVIPDYCHSIAAAWKLVGEHSVIGSRWCFTVQAYIGGWVAGWTDRDNLWLNKTSAETAPMAICLAFLKLP